jgi:DNA-binding transcriptional regulator YdaS (Cro superfamily)
MKINPVDELFAKAGGTKELAARLGVSRQALYLWRGRGYVPAHRLIQIERMYGIPRRQLANPELLIAVGDSEGDDLI